MSKEMLKAVERLLDHLDKAEESGEITLEKHVNLLEMLYLASDSEQLQADYELGGLDKALENYNENQEEVIIE